MKEIFLEAFEEKTQQGLWYILLFLIRELIDAPISILNQHLVTKSFWVQPYPMNIFAFMFSFSLVGLLNVWNTLQTFTGIQGYLINLLSLAIAGGVIGLAIGCTLDPRKKILFTLCGTVGFIQANTFVQQGLFSIFPYAFTTPGEGIYFLLPFLFPIVEGGVFGLFIGLASRNWHSLLRFSGLGSLALFTGFFVNRLSAALMQSYLFHSATQSVAQTNIIGFFIPYLLEGAIMGTLFGGVTKKYISVRT
ncbi:MAG: hypothetical protein LLG42_08555 [Chloroflexi bacterium]|nr:hypothetical protein [Chloroflexota bacterium]